MKSLIFFITTLQLFATTSSLYVLDSKTFKPISDAVISDSVTKVTTNNYGKASLYPKNKKIFIKAYGYKQKTVDNNATTVFLEPFTARALYVSFWAAGSSKYMNKILHLARTTEINTVIVDVKNEFGDLSYLTNVKLAKTIGAHKQRTIRDISKFIKKLKDENLYVIARIVVFKDDRLARHFNDYALKDQNASVWRNREKLAWVSPFEPRVHDYVSDSAQDAASKGFDEINFDYVRFPLKKGLVYSQKLNRKNRVKAIASFLDTANKKLLNYNVYTSVDTYGYVCWNKGDTNIGHTIKMLALHTDYIAPMLYPSGFGVGILGYKNPTDHSYEIINESLKAALLRGNISPKRLRPWLQSFKDYGYDRKFFRSKEVSEQIRGAEHASSSGWMLWNPSSRFSSKGLQDVRLPYPVLPSFKDAKEFNYCFRRDENY